LNSIPVDNETSVLGGADTCYATSPRREPALLTRPLCRRRRLVA
jgi:hypothetical protein